MIHRQQEDLTEPLFITEEIEAEWKAQGYTFDPPTHFSTVRLPTILAYMSDEELARVDDSRGMGEMQSEDR